MKIQVAVDRVSVERAAEIIEAVEGYADIVEVGTSLIKDFGLSGSVGVLKKRFPGQCLLADIKTCDEGAYEFERAYEAGADIATVMGFSAMATIEACADVARRFRRDYLIDLLEVSDERLSVLMAAFPDAVFGVHLPLDKGGDGLEDLVAGMCAQMRAAGVTKIAAAGGVKLGTLGVMREAGVDVAIVGGAITKAADVRGAAREFKENVQRFRFLRNDTGRKR